MRGGFFTLVLLVWALLPPIAAAQTDLERHLGPLAESITLGPDGEWQAAADQRWFRLSQSAGGGLIRYYYNELAPDLQDYTASVQLAVRAKGGAPAYGGLIFGFRDGPAYFAITIGSDGTATLFVRNDQGFEDFVAEDVSARGDGSDVLVVSVQGPDARLTLNGETLFSFNAPSGFAPRVGIFAFGAGDFGYTNYRLAENAGDPLPVPPPQTQDDPLPNPNTPAPADVEEDGPPPIPGSGQGGPPPIPGGSGNGPPPIPGSGQGGPPPIPGGTGNGPPPIPGSGQGGPPPIPGGTGNGPPPIPGSGQGGPPPIPGSSTQTLPPPLPGGGQGGGPPPVPASATRYSPRDQLLLATTFGIFFHEMGHALIGETKLPSTGPEEDVADSFSAHILASSVREAAAQKRNLMKGLAEDSALVWYFLSKSRGATTTEDNWQGEHSPDIRRFRHWFCTIYGADPNAFARVADMVGFEEATRQRCLFDYTKQYEAWEALLALRGRNLGADLPGSFPASEPGARAVLDFQPSRTAIGEHIRKLVLADGTIGGVTELFWQYFVLPRQLQITFRDCDEINAWYDPGAGAVTMCYGVIEYFATPVASARGIDMSRSSF